MIIDFAIVHNRSKIGENVMMNDEPLFSEAEASSIVKRAVELNEQSIQPYKPGITQTELVQVAKEVGVDPECLRKAIAEHLSGKPVPGRKGFRFVQEIERVVEGELHADDFDIVAAELPSRASNSPATQVGRTLNAKVMNGLVMSDVKVTARNGRTRVSVKTLPLLASIFGVQSALFGTGIGAGLIADKGLIGAGITVICVGLAGAAALVFGGTNAGNKSAMRMADRLTKAIAEQTHQESVRDNLANTIKSETSKSIQAEQQNSSNQS